MAFVFLAMAAICQEVKIPSPFEFKLIDSVQGTKPELYIRARSWMANAFVSSKSVIEMEDKDAGRIIGKGIITFTTTYNLMYTAKHSVNFTITIDVKDGRYRCVMNDFNHEAKYEAGAASGGSLENEKPKSFNITKKQWQKVREETVGKAGKTLDSLKKAMDKGVIADDF